MVYLNMFKCNKIISVDIEIINIMAKNVKRQHEEEIHMSEKKYLKWYQKFAFGLGDVAGGGAFAFFSSFVMLYLTNPVGLNAGVIGTLMMFSRVFDGITDVFFGTLIDRTKSKMGKARPWMFYGQFGVSATLFLVFAIPNVSQTMQYAYFFVFYTALNAVFYTANNIAYSSLTALITRNPQERVQCGSIRFILSSITYTVVASVAMGMVDSFGGGAGGWRMTALFFAVFALIVNSISVFMVKEVPEEDEVIETTVKASEQKKISLLRSIKILFTNKYYLLLLAFYFLFYGASGLTGGVGAYFCTYYLEDVSLLGPLTMCMSLPMSIGLLLNPFLVKKLGSMRRVNMWGFVVYTICSILFIPATMARNLPIMMVLLCIRTIGNAPMMGTVNALIAEVSTQIYHYEGEHLEGTMYSCSSIGNKVGTGIGGAIAGWILAFSGFDGMAAVQTASAVNVMFGMYVFTPVITGALIVLVIYLLKVEDENKKWEAEHTKK